MSLVDRNGAVLVPQSHVRFRTEALPPDPLSFSSLFGVLRRRYRLFLAVFCTTVAVSLAAAFLLPRQYTASTSLMIDPRPSGSTVEARSKQTVQPDARVVDTEVKVMTSPALARAVAKRLKLADDPEFRSSIRGPVSLDAVASTLSEDGGLPHCPECVAEL
jgi:uncharacterized protein involved in exopolysaccharide biosynthesis